MTPASFTRRSVRLPNPRSAASAVVVLSLSLSACSSDDSSTTDPSNPYASFQITPASQGFGARPVGAGGDPVTFTVVNTGTALSSPLAATTALQTLVGTSPDSPFVIAADQCTGRVLGPGARCTVSVGFTPSVSGLAQGILNLASGSEILSSASLAGIGGPAGTPSFAIAPTPVAFGSVEVGASPQPQTVLVVNAGSDPILPLGVALGGSGADAFSVTNDSCTGQALTSGALCSMGVTFAPETTDASFAASLSATSGSVTVTAPLTGASNPPAALVLTGVTDFGACAVGLFCALPQTFTLTNNGDTTTGNVGVAIVGADAEDFTFASNGCVLAFLAPGASCSFQVTFTPSAAGPRTATITTSGSPQPPTATLTGTGIGDDAGAASDANGEGNDAP